MARGDRRHRRRQTLLTGGAVVVLLSGLDDTASAWTYIALRDIPITDLAFFGGDGRLQAVGALGSTARRTQSGIATGDSEAQVRQVHGSELVESPEILGIRWSCVVAGSRSLSVGIQNGAAVELWVGESDCTQRPEGCVSARRGSEPAVRPGLCDR